MHACIHTYTRLGQYIPRQLLSRTQPNFAQHLALLNVAGKSVTSEHNKAPEKSETHGSHTGPWGVHYIMSIYVD